MTTKVIELIVEIPDSHEKLTSEGLVTMVQYYMNAMAEANGLPPIEEIKVTRTSPSFVHVPTDDVIPVIHELHDEGDTIEGDEIV
jgi:hypothetical protein